MLLKFKSFFFSLPQVLQGKESSHACLSSCTAGQLLQSIFYQVQETFWGHSLQTLKSLSPHNFGALYLKLSRTRRVFYYSFSSSTDSLRECRPPRRFQESKESRSPSLESPPTEFSRRTNRLCGGPSARSPADHRPSRRACRVRVRGRCCLARRGRQKGAAHFLMLIIIGKFHSEKEPLLPTSFGEWPSELLMGFWVPRVPMVNICNAASSFTSSFCFKESKMKKRRKKVKGIPYSSFSFSIGST